MKRGTLFLLGFCSLFRYICVLMVVADHVYHAATFSMKIFPSPSYWYQLCLSNLVRKCPAFHDHSVAQLSWEGALILFKTAEEAYTRRPFCFIQTPQSVGPKRGQVHSVSFVPFLRWTHRGGWICNAWPSAGGVQSSTQVLQPDPPRHSQLCGAARPCWGAQPAPGPEQALLCEAAVGPLAARLRVLLEAGLWLWE